MSGFSDISENKIKKLEKSNKKKENKLSVYFSSVLKMFIDERRK